MKNEIEEHKKIYFHIKKDIVKRIFFITLGIGIIIFTCASIMTIAPIDTSKWQHYGLLFSMVYIVMSILYFIIYINIRIDKNE
jgi:hypothetical protein